MKTNVRSALSLALALAFTSVSLVAHAVAPAAEMSPKGAFQNDIVGQLADVEKKVLSLEEAVPQNKYNWRPSAGVRSVGEAYMHIAFANYLIPKIATGKEPPADAGWEMNPEKWDKSLTKKEEIKAKVEKSFEYAIGVVKATPDADLDKKVNFFGNEMSTRAVLIVLVGHANEHLGQSVAYARSNKIVPPWSKKESGTEAKEMAKGGKPAAAAPAAAAPAAPAKK